jgi:hypothetical protein
VRTDTPQAHDNLEEYRIRAVRLRKALRSSNRDAVLETARRFKSLPAWREYTPQQIVEQRDRIQHKHALDVVAREAGFMDWAQLKSAKSWDHRMLFDTTRLFSAGSAAFLNLWHRDYGEARELLAGEPKRFLFPYREHFVLCEALFLEARGINANDPDWERIGRDWVNPRDARAQARLAVRLRRAVE